MLRAPRFLSHKTIYIDIDEEITSIVDRIRKTQAGEIIVVVPKRALLIQSLVNLKLLKKESARRKKKLMIVTQDRIGKKLIEKAGILVQGKIEDTFAGEEIVEEKKAPLTKKLLGENISQEESEEIIGSSDYFDEPMPSLPEKEDRSDNIGKVSFEKKGNGKKAGSGKKNQSDSLYFGKIKKQKAKKGGVTRMTDIVRGPKSGGSEKKKEEIQKVQESQVSDRNNYFQFREKERLKNIQAEDYFRVPKFSSPSFARKEEKALRVTKIKGRAGRYFTIFAIVFVSFGFLAAAYFFLPRATIIIHMKTEEKGVSMNVEAGTAIHEVRGEERKLPAKKSEIVKEKTGEFEATGSGSGSGKASGKVVIYNEFGADEQPLVATTRLETKDGKVFRITKNIVVPGMTKVGGETKPGAIEVEAVADKPGEEYNIEPATFKIPGFKGGPKYEKFYAKSNEPMSGGTKGESALVSSEDFASAKNELTAQAREEALQELKSQLGSGGYFFENSVRVEVLDTSSSKKIGSQADKFSYTVSLRLQALSFQEDDLKELIKKSEEAAVTDLVKVDFNKNLNYLLSESDAEAGILKFEVKTDVDVAGGVDISNFKKGALGKSSGELENLIKSYPVIKSADVNFWPFFVNRVPMNEKRVTIEVQ